MKKSVLYLMAAVTILSTACKDELYEKSAVTGVKISESAVKLIIGEAATVSATVEPEGACEVVWSSSDEQVATVSRDGKITSVATGTASIIATTTLGGKVATCAVYVNPIPVSSVELNKEKLSLKVGDTEMLEATVFPDDAFNKTILWSTSDEEVATVSESGKITATGKGEATIIATSQDGGLTAECLVTVRKIAVTGIKLSQTSFTDYPGKSFTLVASVTPDTATYKSIVWTSSNEKVATVSDEGAVSIVNNDGGGRAVIIAASKDNPGIFDGCTVEVLPKISVTGIALNHNKLVSYFEETFTLVATVTPDNATFQGVTWTSSDEKVATVSKDGLVTIIANENRTVVIRAVSEDASSVFAECTVTVVAETSEKRLNRFFHGNSSKTWTWDIEVEKPWGEGGWLASTFPAWWAVPHADLGGQVGAEATGATMRFEAPNKMIKTLNDGTVIEGTYKLDFTRTIKEGWSIGYLVITGGAEELTILGGTAQMKGVIHKEIPILKLDANTVSFSLVSDFTTPAWETGYFYMFRAVKTE